MSFGRTNSLSVIGVTQLDLATSLRSFARDSLPKQKCGCENPGVSAKRYVSS